MKKRLSLSLPSLGEYKLTKRNCERPFECYNRINVNIYSAWFFLNICRCIYISSIQTTWSGSIVVSTLACRSLGQRLNSHSEH